MGDLKQAVGRNMVSNPAFDSLAKTDDMLAIIGVIILAGTVVGAYGSYWQGRVAQSQYNKEFVGKEDTVEQAKRKTQKALLLGSIAVVGTIGVLYYLSKKGEAKA